MEGERLDDPTIGRKSVWRASDGEEVSVEDLCLEQYQREGWKGYASPSVPIWNAQLTMTKRTCLQLSFRERRSDDDRGSLFAFPVAGLR